MPSTATTSLVSELRASGIQCDAHALEEALSEAHRIYGGRKHWSGESYEDHCIGLLRVMLPFEPDEETVIACLFHHVVEVDESAVPLLEKRWGRAVVKAIRGVHFLAHVTVRERRVSLERLRHLLVGAADDIRTILIILCGRVQLLRKLPGLPEGSRRHVAQDALDLFAPVAARLGIYTLKHELESLAFPVIYPVDSERIEAESARIHSTHGAFLPEAADHLEALLRQRGFPARVEGREKHPYSTFMKMRQKGVGRIEDLYDLFALRVVLKGEGECYQVLGLLHQVGHPVPGRFKDFIAFPKPNGYQSLHTTLTGLPAAPAGMFIEVQVRTEEMHREAEYGIAAHWGYKEGIGISRVRKGKVRLQKVIGEGTASLTDHIFVLTPVGDIVELPEGSTPLDFAFRIHTEVGLAFRSAKVNGAPAPLDYVLENGDVVEIMKGPPQPSARWLSILKTSSAQAKLRRYFMHRDRPLHLAEGRELLNEELRKLHHAPLDTHLTLLRLYDGQTLSIGEREELLLRIGRGTLRPADVLRDLGISPPVEVGVGIATHKRAPKESAAGALPMPVIRGSAPMPVCYAKCCSPDPSLMPPIVGVVTREGMVRIHEKNCRMLRAIDPERCVAVEWSSRITSLSSMQ